MLKIRGLKCISKLVQIYRIPLYDRPGSGTRDSSRMDPVTSISINKIYIFVGSSQVKDLKSKLNPKDFRITNIPQSIKRTSQGSILKHLI